MRAEGFFVDPIGTRMATAFEIEKIAHGNAVYPRIRISPVQKTRCRIAAQKQFSPAVDRIRSVNGIAQRKSAVFVKSSRKPVDLEFRFPQNIAFDRARLLRAVSQKQFTVPKGTAFERKTGWLTPIYVCFTVYDAEFEGLDIAFPKTSLNNTLGEYLAKLDKKQLRIAETEKYAHVTFFFNGGVEAPNEGEQRDLIPSPKVATYDLKPEMSAYEVTDKVLEELDGGNFDVIILNFANCEMVGHTGIIPAAVKAVGTVDECVKKVTDKILSMGGAALLTADHGNADKLISEDGSPFTAHTTNPVPVVLISDKYKNSTLRKDGVLADLAPTLLTVMGLPVPAEMTGKSLIK